MIDTFNLKKILTIEFKRFSLDFLKRTKLISQKMVHFHGIHSATFNPEKWKLESWQLISLQFLSTLCVRLIEILAIHSIPIWFGGNIFQHKLNCKKVIDFAEKHFSFYLNLKKTNSKIHFWIEIKKASGRRWKSSG